jgi:hypothetical protein
MFLGGDWCEAEGPQSLAVFMVTRLFAALAAGS